MHMAQSKSYKPSHTSVYSEDYFTMEDGVDNSTVQRTMEMLNLQVPIPQEIKLVRNYYIAASQLTKSCTQTQSSHVFE